MSVGMNTSPPLDQRSLNAVCRLYFEEISKIEYGCVESRIVS